MRKSKAIIMLVMSVGVGLAATLVAAKVMGSNPNAQPAQPKPTRKWVAVAVVKIPEGKEIVATDVKKVEKLIDELPGDAIEQPDAVVGRFAQVIIEKDGVISETKLVTKEKPMDVNTLVKNGYRAMPIKVDTAVGKSDVLDAGLHVDVIVVFEGSEQGAEPISKTILQDIEVLAVRYDKDKQGKPSNTAPTAVLAVLPQDAEKLALAMTTGRIVLIARSSKDSTRVPTNGVTTACLGPDQKAPESAPAAKGPTPAEQLAQAKGLIAAGQQAAGEALLKQIALKHSAEEAGMQAQKELDAIAAAKLRAEALQRFDETCKQLEGLVSTGDFENATRRIEDAQAAFAGLTTADGGKAEDLLKPQLDRVKQGEKHAKQILSLILNYRMNHKDDLAKKELSELKRLYPRSQYYQKANNGA